MIGLEVTTTIVRYHHQRKGITFNMSYEKVPHQVGRCVEGENPRFGFLHFDHVGGALLALLQVFKTYLADHARYHFILP